MTSAVAVGSFSVLPSSVRAAATECPRRGMATNLHEFIVYCGRGQATGLCQNRGERVAKYNQLLRIEEHLGDAAIYAGAGAFPRFTSA